MKQKLFGKTGRELSILGFGCMRLPLLDQNDAASIDYDLSTSMIRKAIDRGVNYVDTAYPYHSRDRALPGESELLVAWALKGGYREKVSVATKLPTWLTQTHRDMDRFLDEQLKRLDVGPIDFYLAHNLNHGCWSRMKELGLNDFLDAALKDGRIKQAGFSFHDRYELFEEIIGGYDWSFAQIQLNYLDVDYQAGLRGLKLAHGRGLGVVVMEPLRGGFLVNHMPSELTRRLAEIRPQWSLADWGLRWVWNQPEVGVVLSGMSAMSHVDGNLASADEAGPLTQEELTALDEARQYFKERLQVNCTSCGYCLPCPSGVNIPKNFSYYNDYFLVDSDVVRARAKYYYAAQCAADENAENCVQCQECEAKCPQNLPISDLMPKAAATLRA
ncbi:MAG: aldo/keto reductase [Candidatus Adiutrix sp.]|jgi:predicted aldo/keto reductase-like oxidoreductase|nr:aldo/keto reductase [Candidatus Adiutrix sp.]